VLKPSPDVAFRPGVLPAQQQWLEQPSAPGGKKKQVFEALHAIQRAIELHDQDKFPHATASLKQDALLFSSRLLYMQGNEDEAVQVLEASLELTVDMARIICAGCHQVSCQVLMLESTCGKCGVARYCSKEHQKLAWNAQVADQKASGVRQLLSHKFLCRALNRASPRVSIKAKSVGPRFWGCCVPWRTGRPLTLSRPLASWLKGCWLLGHGQARLAQVVPGA
jgi:hypothetical protein